MPRRREVPLTNSTQFILQSSLSQIVAVAGNLGLIITTSYFSTTIAGSWSVFYGLIMLLRPFLTLGVEPGLVVWVARNNVLPKGEWWLGFLLKAIVASVLIVCILPLIIEEGYEFLHIGGEKGVMLPSPLVLVIMFFLTASTSVAKRTLNALKDVKGLFLSNLSSSIISIFVCWYLLKNIGEELHLVVMAYFIGNAVALAIAIPRLIRRTIVCESESEVVIPLRSQVYGMVIGGISPLQSLIIRLAVANLIGLEATAVFALLQQIYVSVPSLIMPAVRVVRSSSRSSSLSLIILPAAVVVALFQSLVISWLLNKSGQLLDLELLSMVDILDCFLFGLYSFIRIANAILEVDIMKEEGEKILIGLSIASLSILVIVLMSAPISSQAHIISALLAPYFGVFMFNMIITRTSKQRKKK